jgi:hypothetical protein
MPTPATPLPIGAGLALRSVLDDEATGRETRGGRQAAAYLRNLPPGLADALRRSSETHVWAPCTVCGEGILIARPPVPSKPVSELAKHPGQRCRMTTKLATKRDDRGQGVIVGEHCPGHHYPLELPWGRYHPRSPHFIEQNDPLPW